MNAWERFINTIERKNTDHSPVALIGTNRFFASLSEYSLSDLFYDSRKMIQTQINVFNQFPEVIFIPGCWPDFGVGILSAFGCQIYWEDNSMPQVRGEIISTRADLENFIPPNPHKDGMMPHYLDTLQLFTDRKDDSANSLKFAWSFGPGEMASYFCGLTQFFILMKDDKLFVLDLMQKVTQSIIVWINAQLEIIPHAYGLLLTDDISGMVSQDLYQEIFYPYQKQIREAFPDLKIVFHNDSKTDHLLTHIADAGFEVFNFGKTTSIEKCKQQIADKICLMGNIDPLDLMISGTPQEVYSLALECLSMFTQGDGYILSVGGGMNAGAKPENISALVQATKDNPL
jgi:uroporphyrinogen decarboxylase